MQKKPVLKTSREFFKNDFFENLLPAKKLSKKQTKFCFRKNISRSMYKAVDSIVKKTSEAFGNSQSKEKNLKISFSPEQWKSELVKKGQKSSEFKNQIKERKKLSILYGNLPKKYIQKIYYQATFFQGETQINWLRLLESRLDVVLFRICFFKSIKSARQWISHKKILVNNQIVNIPSYMLKPGDVISITPYQTNSKQIAFFIQEKIKKHSSSTCSILIRKSNLDQLSEELCLRTKSLPYIYWKILTLSQFRKLSSFCHKGHHYSPNENKKFIVCFREVQQLRTKLVNHLTNYSQNFFKNNFLEVRSKFDLIKALKGLENSLSKNLLFCINFLQFASTYTPHITSLKPSHIEVCYKQLTAVFLHSPEKLTFPIVLDLDLIAKSFK